MRSSIPSIPFIPFIPPNTLMKGSWSQWCLGPPAFCQLQITSGAYPIVEHLICGSASAAL